MCDFFVLQCTSLARLKTRGEHAVISSEMLERAPIFDVAYFRKIRLLASSTTHDLHSDAYNKTRNHIFSSGSFRVARHTPYVRCIQTLHIGNVGVLFCLKTAKCSRLKVIQILFSHQWSNTAHQRI